MKDKELEKIEKYQLLKDEFAKVWRTWKVIVVFVTGALGAISVNFKEYVKQIGVNVRLEVIHKTALLRQQTYQRKYCPCKKKEKRDLGPVVTCCNPLPRTINQAEHPA